MHKVIQSIPTPKERKVLKYLSSGLTHKEIACHLCLAKRTIDGIVLRMLKKFRVNNAIQLVADAVRRGWI